nr:hypothetical protein TR92_12090 [Brucella anthropi]
MNQQSSCGNGISWRSQPINYTHVLPTNITFLSVFFVLNAIVFGFILPLEESKVDPLAKIAFI